MLAYEGAVFRMRAPWHLCEEATQVKARHALNGFDDCCNATLQLFHNFSGRRACHASRGCEIEQEMYHWPSTLQAPLRIQMAKNALPYFRD